MSGPAIHAHFRAARRFDALDGLRAVSIIPVVWHHARGHVPGFLGRGYLGVGLFFAISGFLITTLLLREREQSGQISLARFYLRRTLRIFPLYYLVLGVYVAVVALLEPHSAAGEEFRRNLPAFLTYSSNWFVDLQSGSRVIFYFAWSLATEEQFYLAWPWVVRFARARVAPLVMLGAVIVDQLAELLVRLGVLDGALLPVRIVTSFATPIGLGCLAAYALHDARGFARLAPWLGRRGSAAALGATLLAVIALDAPQVVIDLAMCALVVACVMRAGEPETPLLASRPLRHIGTVSYGMYLTHLLVLNAVRRALPGHGPELVFALALPLSIGVATLTHRMVERPALALRARLERRLDARSSPVAAHAAV